MNMTSPQLQKSIMRRVYAVWFLRKVTSPLFVRVYIMLALIFQLVRSVSVTDIVSNIGNVKVFNTFNYLMDAFVKTEPAVQVYTMLFAALGIWVMYERRRQTQFVSE
ncbi:hypothetical protein CL654_03225 [bacterium]|nr:hypothetical protein [bacterium]|tara:strand:+ start:2189 stop:2509 length:321 start_codon:yes stop_codon:yes gene_type:complete